MAQTEAHAGILNMFYRLVREVAALLSRNTKDYPIDSFFITGHSLGGALSQLLALQINHDFPDKPIRVVTNGCPSIFDREVELPNNLNVINFANKWDPIVYGSRLLGFYSLGLTIWTHSEFKWYQPYKIYTENGHSNIFYSTDKIKEQKFYTLSEGEGLQYKWGWNIRSASVGIALTLPYILYLSLGSIIYSLSSHLVGYVRLSLVK